MTGQDPGRTGLTQAAGHVREVILKKTPLPPEAPPEHKVSTPKYVTRLDTKYVTLAETIKGAGYATGHLENGTWVSLPTHPLSMAST